jgi:hypothetical protein
MNSIDPLEQQKEYLRQRAAYITSFAKIEHGRQGRGIVVIGWPAPDSLGLEELLDSTSYMSENTLTMTGLDPADELIRAMREYNPARQALIMCIETMSRSFNVHILTATHISPEPQRHTGH